MVSPEAARQWDSLHLKPNVPYKYSYIWLLILSIAAGRRVLGFILPTYGGPLFLFAPLGYNRARLTNCLEAQVQAEMPYIMQETWK